MNSWTLKINDKVSEQLNVHESFMGGRPKIPEDVDIPNCGLCNEPMTFFFQVGFPQNHPWQDHSLAVFSCTSCAHENHLIPEMLPGPLTNVDIPEGFLDAYQTNFKFLVFKTDSGRIKKEYKENIKYKLWILETTTNPNEIGNKVGGNPNWLLDDETPKSYASKYTLDFLLQIEEGLKFEITKNAPKQIELDLAGRPTPSSNMYYQLFIGNAMYIFGVNEPSHHLVYIITQI